MTQSSSPPNTKSSGDTIHVLMSCDDGFARPLMVSLHSLVEHLGTHRQVALHFLDFGLSLENEKKVRTILDDPRITLDWQKQTNVDWMPKAAIDAGTTPAQCARMLAASIFPQLDRVLFLDADIVVQADIGELWDIPFQTPIAAVRDQFFPWVGLCTWLDLKALGLNPREPHFNGGIWMADLNKWRKAQYEQQLMSFYCQHHASLKTHDQDALNAIFKGNWHELPLGWNRGPWLDNAFGPEDIGVSNMDFWQAKNTPKIIHYPTPNKPWIIGTTSALNLPFFKTASKLELGNWGKAQRPNTLQEQAWGFMMGLAHRIHLLKLGVLSPWHFFWGTMRGMLRHPLLAMRGIFLFITRKLK